VEGGGFIFRFFASMAAPDPRSHEASLNTSLFRAVSCIEIKPNLISTCISGRDLHNMNDLRRRHPPFTPAADSYWPKRRRYSVELIKALTISLRWMRRNAAIESRMTSPGKLK